MEKKIAVISFQPKGGDALILKASEEKPIRYEFYRFLDHWRKEMQEGKAIDETVEIRAYSMLEEEFAELEAFDDYGTQ